MFSYSLSEYIDFLNYLTLCFYLFSKFAVAFQKLVNEVTAVCSGVCFLANTLTGEGLDSDLLRSYAHFLFFKKNSIKFSASHLRTCNPSLGAGTESAYQ